jgi:hypothetical protein
MSGAGRLDCRLRVYRTVVANGEGHVASGAHRRCIRLSRMRMTRHARFSERVLSEAGNRVQQRDRIALEFVERGRVQID